MTPTAAELKEGDQAPPFELKDDAGRTVRLSDLAGKTVVLYFYPKDDTPGCTKEGCDFRDRLDRFEKADAVILGVSPDGLESHQAFKKKFSLPFRLLSDPDHRTASAYGAWGKKKLYGREYEGVFRSTFVIGPDARLKKVYRNVRVDGHADGVLEAVKA